MTIEYRKATHTIYNLQVHIAWITKYRYKVLSGPIAERARDLIRRICVENKVEILSVVVSSYTYPILRYIIKNHMCGKFNSRF
ncbi:MAG: transposase [Candidatus Firestonebacteria bacterium]|nr:transposase [Candidatus Firestonebacteria bacterium]